MCMHVIHSVLLILQLFLHSADAISSAISKELTTDKNKTIITSQLLTAWAYRKPHSHQRIMTISR